MRRERDVKKGDEALRSFAEEVGEIADELPLHRARIDNDIVGR